MSESCHVFHAEPSVEQIADELIAARPVRLKARPQSRYAGLQSRRHLLARKYRKLRSGVYARELSEAELRKFQQHIDGCVDGSSFRQPIRLDVPV